MKLTIFNNEIESVNEVRRITIDIEKDGKEYTAECEHIFSDSNSMATPEVEVEILNKAELTGFTDNDFDAITDGVIYLLRHNESESEVNSEPVEPF